MIDLHIHTTASSDGEHSPRELFKMADAGGLKAISFADHNATGAVDEGMALAGENGVSFITAVEINTLHKGWDLHLLAYGFDPTDKNFDDLMKNIEESRWEQARKRWKKLTDLGFVMDWEDVIEQSGGLPPSGMSFVEAMMSRPENDGDFRLDCYRPGGSRADSPYLNFYLDYLRGGKVAFVPQESVDTAGVIQSIKRAGAIPALAHPSDTPVEFIDELVRAGLMGLEVYSSYHGPELTETWLAVAGERELLVTAGSDFHGLKVKPDVRMGGTHGNSIQLFDKLVDALESKNGVVIR